MSTTDNCTDTDQKQTEDAGEIQQTDQEIDREEINNRSDEQLKSTLTNMDSESDITSQNQAVMVSVNSAASDSQTMQETVNEELENDSAEPRQQTGVDNNGGSRIKNRTKNNGETCPLLDIVKIEPADDFESEYNGRATETCTDGTEVNRNAMDTEVSMDYRIKEENISSTDSDSDDDSSSSGSEEDSNEQEEESSVKDEEEEDEGQKTKTGMKKNNKYFLDDIKTKGELYPEDLPPIEELKITIDENTELLPMGKVSSVVGVLVIVKANKDLPPLNEETVLFLEGRVVFGQVFEVFGPVSDPWYSVRFNSPADITDKKITVGMEIFCAPHVEDFTKYVFVNHLQQLKGSDASWEDNNEPPRKYLDFSDDEEERESKAKMRAKNRAQSGQEEHDQLPGAKRCRNRNNRENRGQQQQENRHSNTSQNFNNRNTQNGGNRFQHPGGPQRFSNRFGQSGHPRPFRNVGPRQEQNRHSGPFGIPTNFPVGPRGQLFTRPQINRPLLNYQANVERVYGSNGGCNTNYSQFPITQAQGMSQNGFSNYAWTEQQQSQQTASSVIPPSLTDRSPGVGHYNSNVWSPAAPQQRSVGLSATPPIVDHRFVQNTDTDIFISPTPPPQVTNTANFNQNPVNTFFMPSPSTSPVPTPPPLGSTHSTMSTPQVLQSGNNNQCDSGHFQMNHPPPAGSLHNMSYPPSWCPPDIRRPPPPTFGGQPRFQSGPSYGQ